MHMHIYTMHTNLSETQIVLDDTRLRREIHARGYSSARQFADAIGVHRNTVGSYLSGRAAMPGALGRILEALDLTPADVLSLSRRRRRVPGLAVADLVDRLSDQHPDLAVVLFGSRARGTAKRHSDYDLGVYCNTLLEFARFSRLLDQVGTWNAESLSTVQLVDLSRAGEDFLDSIADDLVFLAGSCSAWCDLLRKAKVTSYE